MTGAVLTHLSHCFLQRLNSLMRAVTDAAGKRSRNERRLENQIDDREHGVMENSVLNCCFVNMPLFGVRDIEPGVRAVPISFIFQLAVKLENIFLKLPFKSNYVGLVSFVTLKRVPR